MLNCGSIVFYKNNIKIRVFKTRINTTGWCSRGIFMEFEELHFVVVAARVSLYFLHIAGSFNILNFVKIMKALS